MSLRVKFVNSKLEYKTCYKCKKTYPRDEDHFYKMKHPSVKNNYKYYSYCIKCERKRNRAWKKKDSASGNKKLRQIKYLSTERGYFKELWQSTKNSKHGCLFKTFEEFFKCWTDQQKLYGIRCPYLGIEMTKIKGLNINGVRRKSTETNISKDRILSNLPYGKDNLMFISWKANNEKGNITPYIARKYLNFVNQSSLLKHLSKIDRNNLVGDKDKWFEWIEVKKKLTKVIKEINPAAKDVDGESFLSKELVKLRESIGREAMNDLIRVSWDSAIQKKLKEENET
jgi:hypothetical protein